MGKTSRRNKCLFGFSSSSSSSSISLTAGSDSSQSLVDADDSDDDYATKRCCSSADNVPQWAERLDSRNMKTSADVDFSRKVARS